MHSSRPTDLADQTSAMKRHPGIDPAKFVAQYKDSPGRALFTVIDKTASGWVGRDSAAPESDSETLQRVERVLGSLRRSRF